MAKRPKDVDTILAAVDPPMRDVAVALRALVREAAPELKEEVKYNVPSYTFGGKIAVYIMPASDHVNLGFYDGVDLKDPRGLLEGTGKRLRHVKVRTPTAARRAGLKALVRDAERFRKGARR